MSKWREITFSEVGDICPSNVDKKVVPTEIPIKLCNYMDVYVNRRIVNTLPFSVGSVKPAEYRKHRLHKNDIIITKDSESPDDIGIPAVVTEDIDDLVCGYHLAYICPKSADFDGTFIMYALQTESAVRYFSKMSNGLTRYGLTIGVIERQKIVVPCDVNEQKKIAEILTTVDTAIEKTRALIEKYKNIKTGLMQDLLSNGIDEYGNIRSPETHEYKDSPLGMIPVEWDVFTLCELTEKIADRDHSTPVYVQQGVFIVSPKDFDEDDYIDFSNCAQITREAHLINSKKTDIRPNDLIFTRIGAGLGKVCYVRPDMPEFSILHSAAMIRTNNKILPRLLMYCIKSFYLQKQIIDGVQSIGVPDLGMDKINLILVKCPLDRNEQERIQVVLDAASEKIDTEQDYLTKLLNIKQGLMQDLLTHKVPVDVLL
ncbi:MAG: restriction endonuclease subunit S [Eubacteriales bacterium]|nr:restriction endonuclease subunit S [Eubacteriales bacterium]